MRGWARMGALWALVATVVLSAWATPAHATAGDPDPSFSGDGRVAIVPPSDGSFVARAMTLQPDGRIVVAGFSCAPAQGADGTCLNGGGSSFRLARLTPDGGLDPEFGNGGFVTTPIGARSQAYDVIRLGDGSLVAAGFARNGDRDVFALAKYTARGAPVKEFGTDGVVQQQIGQGFAAGAALAASPGGALYVAGQAIDGSGSWRMALARFSGTGGFEGEQFGGPAYGYALGLALDGDSPVLAGIGAGGNNPAGYRFGLARFLPGGGPDPAFGSNGSATYAPGNPQVSSFANAVAEVPGGWVAAGAATGADNAQAMAVVRGTRTGGLDAGFGSGGQTLVSAGDGAVANDVVVLPDGRILAVGQVRTGTGYSFGAARLTAAGAIDPAWGPGGVTTLGFDQPAARATAGAVQPDGKLVTAGIGCSGSARADCTGGTSILVVARQLADPPPVVVDPGPTPTPTPTPPPEARKPTVKVGTLKKRITRSALVKTGVKLKVRTSERVRTEARLTGRRRGGKGKPVLIARQRVTKLQRSFTVRLKPGRKAVRRVRSGKLRLELRVRNAAGTRATRTFTIRLR